MAPLREPAPLSALLITVKVIGGIGDKATERTASAARLEINAAETSKMTNPDVMQSESVLFILLLSNRRSYIQGDASLSVCVRSRRNKLLC
jgi:hypothetical protein